MRTSRIYLDHQLSTGSSISLPGETSHYLGQVLRLRIGDRLLLFNARDGEFAAVISKIEKKDVEVTLESQSREPQPPSLKIHLAQGLSRGDLMDYCMQKATELGVSQITPLITEYGEVKLKADRVENKLRHWRKITVAASEQSGRLNVPRINSPCQLQEWQQGIRPGVNIMLDPSGKESLQQGSSIPVSINLLIGPEGGFSEKEIAWARAHDFSVVSLGSRVLRTETAPVAALAILQHLYGDM